MTLTERTSGTHLELDCFDFLLHATESRLIDGVNKIFYAFERDRIDGVNKIFHAFERLLIRRLRLNESAC